jgi:hypothetical protein
VAASSELREAVPANSRSLDVVSLRRRWHSRGDWLGITPGAGSFAVPFANVVPFGQDRMVGEKIYFDLATLCEQAQLPLEEVRAAAAARRAGTNHGG